MDVLFCKQLETNNHRSPSIKVNAINSLFTTIFNLADTGHLAVRTMLILQDKKCLKEHEIWLYNAYEKILKNITRIASNSNSSMDPFASQYMGKNSVKTDSNHYNSLLEITSYFWASKGGRGTLLQKIIAHLAGKDAKQEVYLSDFLDELIENNKTLNGEVSRKLRKKFDLINFEKNKIVILEIKNRVDSGGTAGRREAMGKFFDICNNICDEVLVDTKSGDGYTIPKLLEKLEIKNFEMLMGLLYNVKGGEAKMSDDKEDGFYSESKSLVSKYESKHLDLERNPENLKINFKKDQINFVIQTVYGSDSTKRFSETITLDNVSKSVFPKSWDDMWLAVNTGIEQRRILLEYKKNHIKVIQKLYSSNPDFKKELNKFKKDSTNPVLIKNVIATIQKDIDPILSKYSDQDVADCLYLCSRFVK